MKKNMQMKNAIDESLSSVHFDMQDMHSVLRAVRRQETPRRAPVRKKQRPLGLTLAAAMTALVIVPVSLLVLRAGSIKPTDITTIASQGDIAPAVTMLPTPQDPQPTVSNSPVPVPASFTEADAIAVARTRFEELCDTTIFSFDEYTVNVAIAEGGDGDSIYTVEMNSIYGNSCSFSVVVSSRGETLSYSTPRLATVPSHLDSTSAEIQAWYDKYGAYIFTWPLDVQAEFSRRYEGGMLRMPREGEITEESILKRAPLFAAELHALEGSDSAKVYCMLYSERAFTDGKARYQVYCFPGGSIDDGMPENYLLVTMLAEDGTIEASELLSTDGL